MRQAIRLMLAATAAATVAFGPGAVIAETITDARSRWTVEVDEAEEATAAMRDLAARNNAPLIFDGVIFEITRDHPVRRADASQKQALVDRWQKTVVRMLEEEDYEVWSDAELQSTAGLSMSDFRRMYRERMPFGMRDRLPEVGRDSYFLANTRSLSCARRNGGLAALVISMYPAPDVAHEYGAVLLVLVGGGDCTGAAAQTHLGRMKRKATRTLVERVQLEP